MARSCAARLPRYRRPGSNRISPRFIRRGNRNASRPADLRRPARFVVRERAFARASSRRKSGAHAADRFALAGRGHRSQTVSTPALHCEQRSRLILFLAPRVSLRNRVHSLARDSFQSRLGKSCRAWRSDRSLVARLSHLRLGDDGRDHSSRHHRDSFRQTSRSRTLVSCPCNSARARWNRFRFDLLATPFARRFIEVLSSRLITSIRRLLIAIGFAIQSSLFAYGPTGHEIVGGIADKLIAKTPSAEKIYALTDGITLERASTIADEIKAWDKNGVDDPNAFPHYPEHPKIDNQLRELWRANPPTQDSKSATPSHHWFHYTDVPVLNLEKYTAGKTGRTQWDIVHMIAYCVDVLRGDVPENNPRKITKPVAVILLAHYAGDIHQPLHVGAEYFNHADVERLVN